jgi:putative ABC transport system permease protein
VVAQALAGARIEYPNGDTEDNLLTAIDPHALTGLLEPTMVRGEVTDLTDDGMLIDFERARDHHVQVGDTMKVVVAGGEELRFTIEGTTDDENMLGYFTITQATYQAHAKAPLDTFIYGTVDKGQDIDEVIGRVEEATDSTPGLDVLDKEGFIGSIVDQVAFMLNFISGLLFLSILIALIGVANTLSLSISERVRELGLLRAVGMDRRQLKRSIRWEAVIISMLGTTVGLVLAVSLGWALIQTFGSQGLTEFSVQWGTLVALLIGGAFVGTVAAVFPARRASKLEILDAIATE